MGEGLAAIDHVSVDVILANPCSQVRDVPKALHAAWAHVMADVLEQVQAVAEGEAEADSRERVRPVPSVDQAWDQARGQASDQARDQACLQLDNSRDKSLDKLKGNTLDDSPPTRAADDSRRSNPQLEELLILGVMAKPEAPFGGEALVAALRGQGLKYGDMGIVHRVDDSADRSEARLRGPGEA